MDPFHTYTSRVELEARAAAVEQILARNATVTTREDDVAGYVLRTALAASIAQVYRAGMASAASLEVAG